MAKRVAVIGAGASGLTAIKCCLDEKLEVVCFERTDDIGGLWNYTEEARKGQACVMKSTVINTSKEMMAYSDFPIPKEYSIFMHNTYVKKYFQLYAENFDLLKHIRFNSEVMYVKQASDFAQTGRWEMEVQDVVNQTKTTEYFDGLLICTGHHADMHLPTFQGQEKFKGQILHSHDYKDMKGYENKRIVIIGIGNSGGDMAVELSRVSKVFLSTRRGAWVLNRVGDKGIPADMNVAFSRLGSAIFDLLPMSVKEMLVQNILNNRFDHERFALKPQHSFFGQHPTVNDDLPNRIVCGAVTIKPNVRCITETGIEFDDGTFEENIDVIVLATGYIFGFPFMDKSVIDVKNNRVELFKYMFPPELEKPTCAVIGCFQPLGAIMPISEMQCRLATQVFKGITKLPTRGEMWFDIKKKEVAMAKRYVASQRHTIQVDFVPIMDELAELVGCKPDFKELFKTDPKLAWKCLTGPCTPYQFRLMGRHKWPGARDAIFTQWDRTFHPLKTRPVMVTTKQKSLFRYFFILLFVVIIWSLLF
ncbi:flavin-containing monooxygenase 5-like [Liolophura sinensis]|uniref:flavin-containing monooxygenase 5-like n=1 Tax=Liolophura sinensis TaxID=3198878 RepID=UPI003157F5D6